MILMVLLKPLSIKTCFVQSSETIVVHMLLNLKSTENGLSVVNVKESYILTNYLKKFLVKFSIFLKTLKNKLKLLWSLHLITLLVLIVIKFLRLLQITKLLHLRNKFLKQLIKPYNLFMIQEEVSIVIYVMLLNKNSTIDNIRLLL